MRLDKTLAEQSQAVSLEWVAYLSALFFLMRLVTFFIPALRDAATLNAPFLAELICILGIIPHLLIFPLIEALPAPAWAKSAGWGWLVIDMATDIMALNGVNSSIYLSLKYGGHLSATLWVMVTAGQGRGTFRWVGWLFAFNLGTYSFLSPFLPAFLLSPSLVLLPGWLFLIGRYFRQCAFLHSNGIKKGFTGV